MRLSVSVPLYGKKLSNTGLPSELISFKPGEYLTSKLILGINEFVAD